MRGALRCLAGCAALLWMVWGAGPAAWSAPASPPLRFGLAAAPITLDPRYATDAASTRIEQLLYRALVTFDAAARPVPDLARWERLSPTEYRFHLGPGGREFQDGEHLSSADVKATYESILDPATGSPLRDTLKRVAGIVRIDTPGPDTVDFILARPNVLFPSYLTVGILPKRLLDSGHRFAQDPVGSGRFAFVAWPDAERLLLRRRRDGQAFEFLVVRDPTVRVLKLLRGEIDMLQNDLPPELITYLEHCKDVRVERGRGTNLTYLGFNLRDPVTGRLRVRRAIAHAIDRAAIIGKVLGGAARPAEALLPPDHWAGNPQLHGYAYDPDRARALLREAGFGPGHPATITYKTSSDPFRVRLATIIQYQLGQVGIHVRLQSYDWGTFYGDIKSGRFQMYSLSWVGIKSPDIFRYVFYSTSVPPEGANRGYFSSPVADHLIDAAEASSDLDVKARDYRELQAYLLKELPYLPLWFEDQTFVARRDIVGYHVEPDGNYDGLNTIRRVSPARRGGKG